MTAINWMYKSTNDGKMIATDNGKKWMLLARSYYSSNAKMYILFIVMAYC
jgi:hypothetical protein